MRWLRVLGKFLISAGFGVLLFVAWVLWGTGIYTAQQQERLEEEFSQLPEITPQEKGRTKGGDEPRFVGPGDDFQPAAGEPVFQLDIPAIDLRDYVVQGVGEEELRMGPGHYPDCREGFSEPLCTEGEEIWPGEQGRVIVSGHRTTYSQPFWDLDKLEEGDEIITDTQWGTVTYSVTDIEIVSPDDKTVADPDPEGKAAEIALTTCNPKFSAAERLVVYGKMKEYA